MRFIGTYTLSSWSQETPLNRARAIAHYIHYSLRSSFASEYVNKPKNKNAGQRDGYADLMKSMGLKF